MEVTVILRQVAGVLVAAAVGKGPALFDLELLQEHCIRNSCNSSDHNVHSMRNIDYTHRMGCYRQQ